jgi:hypothetical protein
MVFFEAYCTNARRVFDAAVELNNERLSKAILKPHANKDFMVEVRNDVFSRTQESFKDFLEKAKMLKKSYSRMVRILPKHREQFLEAKFISGETKKLQMESLQKKFELQLANLFRDYTKQAASCITAWRG